MYKAFFEMERMPFVRDVPIQELYESPAMSEALGRLAYAADCQLFAVVTADAGCGKSTLLRRFSGSLSKEEYLFLYLSDSKLVLITLYLENLILRIDPPDRERTPHPTHTRRP